MKDRLIIKDAKIAKIVTSPLRLKIMEILKKIEKGSSTDIAKKMKLPPSNISYHIKQLEKVGVIEIVEKRRVKNLIEKIYSPVAKTIEFSLVNGGEEDVIKESFLRMNTDYINYKKMKEEGRNKFESFIDNSRLNLTLDEARELKNYYKKFEKKVEERERREDLEGKNEETVRYNLALIMIEIDEES